MFIQQLKMFQQRLTKSVLSENKRLLLPQPCLLGLAYFTAFIGRPVWTWKVCWEWTYLDYLLKCLHCTLFSHTMERMLGLGWLLSRISVTRLSFLFWFCPERKLQLWLCLVTEFAYEKCLTLQLLRSVSVLEISNVLSLCPYLQPSKWTAMVSVASPTR